MRLELGTVFTFLFVVATAVAILARRLRIPYTVALVLAGLALGTQHLVAPPRLTQEFLFALVLPGLIFQAAFNLDPVVLWHNRLTLTLLTVPGVALAIVITALLTPLGLALFGAGVVVTASSALVFAALISATDPIAVLALFRELGASDELALLVEGESLLNDATAYAFFLGALTIGTGTLLGAVGRFALGLVGGAAVGLAVGAAVTAAIARVDDAMVEVTLTVIAAYGSFAAARQFGFSGILATVVAGIICGLGAGRSSMSPTTRTAVDVFWEYTAFALNSVVFLMIGSEVQFVGLLANWRAVVAAFLAVLAARALTVGAVATAVSPTRRRLPWRWSAVLTWGGLRGALSMVLALSLPESMPNRSLLVTMTFGVVTLSILGQGFSMPALLRALGLTRRATDRFHVMRIIIPLLILLSPAALSAQWKKPSDAEIKSKLTPTQYEVTQHAATETPFHNEYWDNHRAGIYVDVVSGEPLFSSTDKFESGTGWPSFTKPLVPSNVTTKDDPSLPGEDRTEVRSAHAGSHLGHVFDDGPPPTGKRYCMNSAAMRFIPVDSLRADGYGQFQSLFTH
jgi:CPA1 family monovalent cation:H+ antiporter